MTSHVVSGALGALTWPGTSRWQLSFASTTLPEGNAAPARVKRGWEPSDGTGVRNRIKEIIKEGRGRERETEIKRGSEERNTE